MIFDTSAASRTSFDPRVNEREIFCEQVIGDALGGIAQLAEHELCKLGVTGSNPVASTSLRDESRRGRSSATAWPATLKACGRVAQLVRARP